MKQRVFVFHESTLEDGSDGFRVDGEFNKPEEAYDWLKKSAEGDTYNVASMIRADIRVDRVTVPRAVLSGGVGFVTRKPRDPSRPRKPRGPRKPRAEAASHGR